jgi:hypothetical protein
MPLNSFAPGEIIQSALINENFEGLADGTLIQNGSLTPDKLISGAGSTWVSQTWVPTITGFSSAPTGGLYYYQQFGKWVTLIIRQPNNGTSNATSFTISLPLNARTVTNMVWPGLGRAVDGGSSQTTPAGLSVDSGASVLNIYPTYSFGNWTASSGKRLIFGTITYEVA